MLTIQLHGQPLSSPKTTVRAAVVQIKEAHYPVIQTYKKIKHSNLHLDLYKVPCHPHLQSIPKMLNH